MKQHLSKLPLILTALLVCGCGDDFLVASGEVQVQGQPRALSDSQVQYLNSWLEQHDSDWFKIMYTPPHGDLHISVRTQTGESGSIEFLPQEKQRATLIFWAMNPRDNRMASFDASDVNALRQELRASK
jgi:hypothetical protein